MGEAAGGLSTIQVFSQNNQKDVGIRAGQHREHLTSTGLRLKMYLQSQRYIYFGLLQELHVLFC